jgi:hypothetical protein
MCVCVCAYACVFASMRMRRMRMRMRSAETHAHTHATLCMRVCVRACDSFSSTLNARRSTPFRSAARARQHPTQRSATTLLHVWRNAAIVRRSAVLAAAAACQRSKRCVNAAVENTLDTVFANASLWCTYDITAPHRLSAVASMRMLYIYYMKC